MTAMKELKIRKHLFRLLIYNLYKYDLTGRAYYILMDFVCIEENKFKLIDKVFKVMQKHNLTVSQVTSLAKNQSIRGDLPRNEFLDKMLIDSTNNKN